LRNQVYSGVGADRRHLISFAGGAGNKRDKFAVKAGFANQETRRNGNADPAVLQNIDGEAGAARGEFGIDAQVVVNARERGFYGRRSGSRSTG